MSWFGWLWIDSSWVRACGPHDTMSDCHRALSRMADVMKKPDRLACMTQGGAPLYTPEEQ